MERGRDGEMERGREGECQHHTTHSTHTHIHIQHTKLPSPFLFNLFTSSVKKPLSPSSLLLLGAESLNPRPSSLVVGKEGEEGRKGGRKEGTKKDRHVSFVLATVHSTQYTAAQYKHSTQYIVHSTYTVHSSTAAQY